MLQNEDVLLQSLSCLNSREQKSPDGLQYCKVIARAMPGALVMSHSNAAVERSLSINKKILTTQHMGMKGETIIEFRASKAAFTECGGEHSVPISLDMVKVADKSHRLYKEQLKEEQMKTQKKEQTKRS